VSWIQKLYETYEKCAGHEPPGAEPLMPVSHTSQLAHIEIAIDASGRFRRAVVTSKESIVLPATERSASRGYGEAPHPLAEKIQYCAGDYSDHGGVKEHFFDGYLALLKLWCESSSSHPKAVSVLKYVQMRSVVADLVKAGVLHERNGVLLTDWPEETAEPEIFTRLTAKSENGRKVRDQGDALVRWVVETPGDERSQTWKDETLQAAWRRFDASRRALRGLCMVGGDADSALADQHPAKLRNGADKAKIISSNDESGFTFRGRFLDAQQAAGVSFEITQKAHNALRWLVARQGRRHGDQVIVSWAVSGRPVPDPTANTLSILGVEVGTTEAVSADTAQAFAHHLNRAISGYRAALGVADDIVVMGLDSATPGRMAITFYRELKSSEFLGRLESWHSKSAWPQNLGKGKQFVGAAAPGEIAEAAYGRRLDDKLRTATVERLLPCIVDAREIPRDLVRATFLRACNRAGLDAWEWEKCLGIACSLFRGINSSEDYQMALENERRTRDYLYGRLLAVAESIESRALYVAGEERETTAARLMQRFADRPFSTWKTIELSLAPYKARLRAQRAGFLHEMEKLLDEIVCRFPDGTFADDARLSGEFLLAYHCQRRALRTSRAEAPDSESADVRN